MIKDAVFFILHCDHVVTISWGHKKFHLGPDETITLPRLCRKLRPIDIWQSYKSALSTKSEGIGRSNILLFDTRSYRVQQGHCYIGRLCAIVTRYRTCRGSTRDY